MVYVSNKEHHFDDDHLIEHLKHYLPSQAPLKDFIHHNTLHAFQTEPFNIGIRKASKIFGYKVSLSLAEYRQLYHDGKIDQHVINQILIDLKGDGAQIWLSKMTDGQYSDQLTQRIGALRGIWKSKYRIDIDFEIHPILFRILCSYLDQGISVRNFPVTSLGFLESIKELEKNSYSSFFKTDRPRGLLFDKDLSIKQLLTILVGDEKYFEDYIFDQQFSHPGWSGIVAQVEDNPHTLVDRKSIRLKNLIIFELLLEIDALDNKFGTIWAPLSAKIPKGFPHVFDEIICNEEDEVLSLWQKAYEFTFFDKVLLGIKNNERDLEPLTIHEHSFQALLCIDDRECSMRRYMEHVDKQCQTFGTAGFFGVEFYYQPMGSSLMTKVCPAPVSPKYLIKEIETGRKVDGDFHLGKLPKTLIGEIFISHIVGFWSALKLAGNIFRPTFSPATSASEKHMNKDSKLTIEFEGNDLASGLNIGYSKEEMANRVESTLKSIGLVDNFAPIVYIIGHGSTSVNNTHYAGYDCGACSGRPGSVNARVFAYMANDAKVRELLAEKGIIFTEATIFIGALHDTSRDEMYYYDDEKIDNDHLEAHSINKMKIEQALRLNATERSQKFESINSNKNPNNVHKAVKRRSVSLFEPRPELNHATNALAIVGRREITQNLFLDRRAFMNSYDYRLDTDGKYLINILNAVAPVCGGINLEYYFSRVDNNRLGAGTKLAHNVMGLFGVANGIEGDLRTGLPSQMIEVHEPLRLLVVVEHFPHVVLSSIKANPATFEWFDKEWINLVCINPADGELYQYVPSEFVPYQCVSDRIEEYVLGSNYHSPIYKLKN